MTQELWLIVFNSKIISHKLWLTKRDFGIFGKGFAKTIIIWHSSCMVIKSGLSITIPVPCELKLVFNWCFKACDDKLFLWGKVESGRSLVKMGCLGSKRTLLGQSERYERVKLACQKGLKLTTINGTTRSKNLKLTVCEIERSWKTKVDGPKG